MAKQKRTPTVPRWVFGQAFAAYRSLKSFRGRVFYHKSMVTMHAEAMEQEVADFRENLKAYPDLWPYMKTQGAADSELRVLMEVFERALDDPESQVVQMTMP